MRTDAELFEAARGGDLDAFAEIVHRHEQRIRRVVARLLDDERDAEEATQDTFVQAWRNLHRFRGQAGVFTWLYRIAVNEALQHRRRRRQQAVPLLEDPNVADRRTERETEASELRRILLGSIRALPDDYRAALVLRDIEGLSSQEVADVLEVTVAAAKSRIHRARLQVRDAIEHHL